MNTSVEWGCSLSLATETCVVFTGLSFFPHSAMRGLGEWECTLTVVPVFRVCKPKCLSMQTLPLTAYRSWLPWTYLSLSLVDSSFQWSLSKLELYHFKCHAYINGIKLDISRNIQRKRKLESGSLDPSAILTRVKGLQEQL